MGGTSFLFNIGSISPTNIEPIVVWAGGRRFETTLVPSHSGWLRADDLSDDFVKAIYNSDEMTVATKEEERYNFSLTGIAAAFTGLNRCGAAIRAEKNVTPNVNTASIGTVAPAPAAQPSIHEVPLVRDRHGTFTLLAMLNGTTTLAFTLDTGATNVTIPQSIAQELMRDGSLTVADYVGNAISILPDGTKRHDTLYRLRSVTIGGLTVTDVECSVGDEGSALLLGQSFLSKFGSWSVDNGRGVLVLK